MSTDRLERYKKTWNEKRILRKVYQSWYRMVLAHIIELGDNTIELGSGTGNFKEFEPRIKSSDIESCPWLDYSFDATEMPFADCSVDNLILIDTLHHLSQPIAFFEEAFRVLKPKGRICIIEPFESPFSRIIYSRFHPEPFHYNVDLFRIEEAKDKDPWDSNQAIAKILFYKERNRFDKHFQGRFRILKRARFSYLLYPLTGGFENKSLIPDFLYYPFLALETYLSILRILLAFRCFIVIERL